MRLKDAFLEYLRTYYGAESSVTRQALPPMEVGPNYPAFQKFNAGLGDLAGGFPMLQEPPMAGGVRQLGGPRDPGISSAQDILLGR